MKKRLKLFFLNLIATTDYDKMSKTTKVVKLVFDIISSLIYTAYAIYVLTQNNSKWTMYFLIGVVLIFIVLIGMLIARSKTNLKYSKKNYKLTTKTLKKLIKLLSLLPPIFVIAQKNIIKNGWETALNIYAIIHLSFIIYKLSLYLFRLMLHKYKKDKYLKKEEKSKKRKNVKKNIYKAIQKVAKNKLNKENYTIEDKGNYQIAPDNYYKDNGENPEIEIITPPIDNIK